jgi:predicted transcriptional regulator
MLANAIVLSIRPYYAEKIFQQIKTVELRRVRPKYLKPSSLALIYVSSPVQSLAGAFKVDFVLEKPLDELWAEVQEKAGVTKQEFDDYFQGVETGIGIFFTEVWTFENPIKVQDWAEQGIDFRPPQGFRYATEDELTSPQIAELVDYQEYALQDKLFDM